MSCLIKILFFTLFVFYGHIVNAETIIKPKDSLSTKSFEELKKAFDQNKRDSINAKIYAKAYLEKGKREKDTLEIANGYNMFCSFNGNRPKIVLQFADSIIKITIGKQYARYPTRGYLSKGYALSLLRQPNKALKEYLEGIKYAELKNDSENFIAFKHNIALIKSILGKYDEALVMFRENLEFIKTQDTVSKFHPHYIVTLYKMADVLDTAKDLDLAHLYLKKAIKKVLSGENQSHYPRILLSFGVNSYKRKEYTTAIDTLQKAFRLLQNREVTNKSIAYSYIGRSLLKQKKDKEAIFYLEKVDSIVSFTTYTIEVREGFALLIDHYNRSKNKDKQLELMQKLIKYDSVTNAKYSKLDQNLVKNYDTARLIDAKNELIQKIKNENRRSTSKIIIFGIASLLLITTMYLIYYKRRRLLDKKELDQKLLEYKNDKQGNNKPKNKGKELELSEDIVNEILKRLENFEDNKSFLKRNLTMTKVAKELKTNSTYLSKVINTHKKKNFANYINDLRIEYCIHRLKSDKKFRLYSIKSIAEESSFNNVQSFSNAFLKTTGEYPSDFIKTIKSMKNSDLKQ